MKTGLLACLALGFAANLALAQTPDAVSAKELQASYS